MVLAHPKSQVSPDTGPSTALFPGTRVLVVDDIAANRDVLIRRLARLGITQCAEAGDGREALDRLATERFDLMLLDIMMPEINGFDVLEALRENPERDGMPVIVISAISEVDAVARCIQLGAEDVLFKPFNPTLLRARVFATLEKKQLRDLTREQLHRKQAELAEARTLQLSLVPADVVAPGLELRAVLQPAHEVGGDLVDHFVAGGGLRVLLLGDVSDKGAGAALMMARTHALFRSLGSRPDSEALFRDPAVAVACVNSDLCPRNEQCMFVTMLVAVLDLATMRLRYTRAGHVPPFVRRSDGRLERLHGPTGPPLGLDPKARYGMQEISLEAGDAMLIISDGITDAMGPDGTLFGDKGVTEWLLGPRDLQLADLLDRVQAHEAGNPPFDDVAALLLRLNGPDTTVLSIELTPRPDGIAAALERVETFLDTLDVDRRTRHHMALGLDELLSNLATHGEGMDRPALLRMDVSAQWVRAELGDVGLLHDPLSTLPPDLSKTLDERPVGGMGLFLLTSLAEGIEYTRRDGHNITAFRLRREVEP